RSQQQLSLRLRLPATNFPSGRQQLAHGVLLGRGLVQTRLARSGVIGGRDECPPLLRQGVRGVPEALPFSAEPEIQTQPTRVVEAEHETALVGARPTRSDRLPTRLAGHGWPDPGLHAHATGQVDDGAATWHPYVRARGDDLPPAFVATVDAGWDADAPITGPSRILVAVD